MEAEGLFLEQINLNPVYREIYKGSLKGAKS